MDDLAIYIPPAVTFSHLDDIKVTTSDVRATCCDIVKNEEKMIIKGQFKKLRKKLLSNERGIALS